MSKEKKRVKMLKNIFIDFEAFVFQVFIYLSSIIILKGKVESLAGYTLLL